MPAIASTGSRGTSDQPAMASARPDPEGSLNGQQQPQQQQQHYRPRQPQEPLANAAGGDPLLASRPAPAQGTHWEVVNGLAADKPLGHRCKGMVHQQQQQKSFAGPPLGAAAAGVAPPYVTVQQPGALPHVVHLHINPGETIFFQMGDQMQLIQGPATVRMVSNSTTPPMAVPVQVPPGHVVQQIVDENGTLRHIILSPQPPHVAMPQVAPSYTGPAAGGAPPQPAAAFFPYATASTGPGTPPGPPFAGQFHSAMQTPLGAGPHSPQGHTVPGVGQPVLQPAHKDERSQKQFFKLRKKLESRQGPSLSASPNTRSDSASPKSSHSSPGSASYNKPNHSNQKSEEADAAVRIGLSSLLAPVVAQVSARDAVAEWSPPEAPHPESGESSDSSPPRIPLEGVTYELLLSEKGQDRPAKLIKCGSALHSKLEDLKPATEYLLCIQALLDAIKGSPSPCCEFQTECCEPDAPLPPKLVTRTKNTLVLKWNAPCDNGSKITCYVLECDQGTEDKFEPVFSGAQKQFKVSKLAASTAYCFRLAASNSIGMSPWSSVSRLTTCGAAPSAPETPRVSQVTASSASLEWASRPSDDSFTLSLEQEGSQHGFLAVYNGADTHFTCQRLIRNTEYRFRLVAHNEEGSSGPSRTGSLRTLPDRPGRPSRPSTKGRVHSQQLTASWDPPKDDGGSAITQYCLQMDSGKGFVQVYCGPDRDYVCANLEPGATYRLRVNCTSAGGTSDFSEVSSQTTVPLCPGPCDPPRMHGKPKAISAHLKWVPPAYNGGANVDKFELRVAPAGDPGADADGEPRVAYRGPDLDCVVAGLLPGRSYVFQVRALNVAGAGPWSEPLEAQSGAGVPDAPRVLSAQARSPSSALVSWEEAVCHGAPVSEYLLECCQPTGSEEPDTFAQVYAGRSTHFEARGLEPATCYRFRVLAVSGVGPSGFSETSECTTPPGVPGAVGPLECVRGNMSLELSWEAPQCHGSEITHYLVEVSETSTPSAATTATAPSSISAPVVHTSDTTHLLVSNLRPETCYKVRVQAVNSVGVGPLSSPALRTSTHALPPLPPTLECVGISHNSLRLRWTNQGGQLRDFLTYTLEMEVKPGLFVVVYKGPSHSFKALRLQENQSYSFRIQAASEVGEGPYSEACSFTTCRALPPAVKAPRATPQGDTSCLLEWQPVRLPADDPISYVVQLQHSGNSEFSVVYRGRDTSCTLSNLSPQSFHWARVGAVRHCPQSPEPLQGPYGPATSFQLSAEPASCPSSQSPGTWGVPQSTRSGPSLPSLGDQQWAGILVGVFTLLAVGAAVLLQELVAWSQ